MRIAIVYWVLAAVFIVVALAVPRLRVVGIAGGIALGLMLGWGMLQRWVGQDPPDLPARGQPSTPTTAVTAIEPGQIVATELRLSGNGAPFELRGRVRNTSSDMRLKSFTLAVVRRDCYEGALDPSGCVILWQGRQWVGQGLEPGEEREFQSSFWARGEVARVRGTVRDEIQLVAAEGEPVDKTKE